MVEICLKGIEGNKRNQIKKKKKEIIEEKHYM